MVKKIIVASGAFKHSITLLQAQNAIVAGLHESGLRAELIKIPLADGGNGTLDAFLQGGGERVEIIVDDPLGRRVNAPYGLIADGHTAIIEMALASGLELVDSTELNPLIASTFGTGQLMQSALNRGVKRVIIGMGGSATVDGGVGALAALGVRFLDSQRELVPPRPSEINRIVEIDASHLDTRWQDVQVIIAADVDNPALGERGAAMVFGPQKGASPDDIQQLEGLLSYFFTLIAEKTGRDVRTVSGAGAAGALAGGLMSFLNANMTSGIDLLLEHVRFEEQLQDTDLVITSEGKIDTQTLGGKGPLGIARLAHHYHVPCVVFVGALDVDEALLQSEGVTAVLPIIDQPMSLEAALRDGPVLLQRSARRLGYLLRDLV